MTLVAWEPKEWDEGELILSEYSSKANKDQQFNHEKKKRIKLKVRFYAQLIRSDYDGDDDDDDDDIMIPGVTVCC